MFDTYMSLYFYILPYALFYYTNPMIDFESYIYIVSPSPSVWVWIFVLLLYSYLEMLFFFQISFNFSNYFVPFYSKTFNITSNPMFDTYMSLYFYISPYALFYYTNPMIDFELYIFIVSPSPSQRAPLFILFIRFLVMLNFCGPPFILFISRDDIFYMMVCWLKFHNNTISQTDGKDSKIER